MAINNIAGSPSIRSGNVPDEGGMDLRTIGNDLNSTSADATRKMEELMKDKNLSDTDRMMQMQIEMNVASMVVNLRTNMIKVVSDTLRAIVRNVA